MQTWQEGRRSKARKRGLPKISRPLVSSSLRKSMMKKTDPLLFKPPCITAVIVGRIEKRTVKRALSEGAGILEIRVDTFARRSPATLRRDFERLRGYDGVAETPLILTCRDPAEGGASAVGVREKRLIFKVLTPIVDYIDIELRKANVFGDVIDEAKSHGVGVIVSHHDFRRTPSRARLSEVIERGRAAGGDIVKIAATAKTAADVRRLAGLLTMQEAGQEGLIVIGMGALGRATRVFFPLLGSLTTYGSVTRSSAPGQMPVAELAEAFRAYGISSGQGA